MIEVFAVFGSDHSVDLMDWDAVHEVNPHPLAPEKALAKGKDAAFLGGSLEPHWTNHELVFDDAKQPDGWGLAAGQRFLACSENFHRHHRDLLAPFGELLLASCHGGTAYVFNCTNVVDAVDSSRTVYELGNLQGPFNDYASFEFLPQRIDKPMLFRLPRHFRSWQLISRVDGENDFMKYCEESGIHEGRFAQVWISS